MLFTYLLFFLDAYVVIYIFLWCKIFNQFKLCKFLFVSEYIYSVETRKIDIKKTLDHEVDLAGNVSFKH